MKEMLGRCEKDVANMWWECIAVKELLRKIYGIYEKDLYKMFIERYVCLPCHIERFWVVLATKGHKVEEKL